MSIIVVDDLESLQHYDLSSIKDDVLRHNLESCSKFLHFTSKWRINPDGTHTCLEFRRVGNEKS